MPLPGAFIEGKYEILEKIREGGMGAIYKVRHRLLDEIRVVKVMKPQVVADEELKRRFAEEARTATRLKHPNICTIHDFALDEDGTAYLVMEYIEGVNLADLLRSQGPPGLAMTLQIAHQALLALGYLHRRNVVHRDIAPDNLMLTHDEDGHPRIKLIDLGIAKALDKPGGDLTSTGVFLGKLKYASPEQYGSLAAGEKIDARSDLYSLGVVLYELLTGRRPFQGDTPPQLLRAHLFEPPVPFSESDPEGKVPEDVRQVILKALEKNRDARYASAEEFDREIVTLLHRYGGAADVDATVQILSSYRPSTGNLDATVTPSAQDRLDRQFGAHTTPAPSRLTARPTEAPGTVALSENAAQRASAGLQAAGGAEPVIAAPRRGRGPQIAMGGAAVLVVVLALVLLRGRQPALVRQAEKPAIVPSQPRPAATPEVSTAARERVPTLPAEAVVIPPAIPTPAPAAERTSPRTRPTRPPPERRPTVLIAQQQPRTPAVEIPIVPTAVRREPTRGVERVFVPTDAPRPTPAPPRTSSDEDRVRDVIREYVAAQSGLDVDRYLRIRPALAGQRDQIERSFAGLRSQEVQFDIRSVDVRGNQAEVRGHERRLFSPRVGGDQRWEGPRTVLLEKRGNAWVITSIQ